MNVTRYHVNPATGNPGVCRVTEGGQCPFGIVEAAHRSSLREVFAVVETVFSDYNLPQPLRRTWLVMPERLHVIRNWVNPTVCGRSRVVRLEATA